MPDLNPMPMSEIERAEFLLRLDPDMRAKLRAHFLYEDLKKARGEVDHPTHYNMGGPIGEDGSAEFEVIKIVEDLGWGFGFCMGNALKYVLRAPYKGTEAKDLRKARWYLERSKRHRGRVRAMCFRKISISDAAEAWGLLSRDIPSNDEIVKVREGGQDPLLNHRLAMTVGRISEGDPFEALNELNVYMVRFGPDGGVQEKEKVDADGNGNSNDKGAE